MLEAKISLCWKTSWVCFFQGCYTNQEIVRKAETSL